MLVNIIDISVVYYNGVGFDLTGVKRNLLNSPLASTSPTVTQQTRANPLSLTIFNPYSPLAQPSLSPTRLRLPLHSAHYSSFRTWKQATSRSARTVWAFPSESFRVRSVIRPVVPTMWCVDLLVRDRFRYITSALSSEQIAIENWYNLSPVLEYTLFTSRESIFYESTYVDILLLSL